jgi:hypothetical protein
MMTALDLQKPPVNDLQEQNAQGVLILKITLIPIYKEFQNHFFVFMDADNF